jgi:hypothetical protein
MTRYAFDGVDHTGGHPVHVRLSDRRRRGIDRIGALDRRGDPGQRGKVSSQQQARPGDVARPDQVPADWQRAHATRRRERDFAAATGGRGRQEPQRQHQAASVCDPEHAAPHERPGPAAVRRDAVPACGLRKRGARSLRQEKPIG